MRWMKGRGVVGVLAAVVALVGCGAAEPTAAPSKALVSGDWPMYRGDYAGTGHSQLAEVSRENVAELAQVWGYSLQSAPTEGGEEPGSARSQATPIVVDGVMYLPTADAVVALDPVAGTEIWRHAVAEGRPSRRGVAYWRGAGDIADRVIFTAFDRLVALDAGSGTPVPEFGEGGSVALGIPYLSVPLVYDDIVVVGANTPRGAEGGIGNARAFDARTGAKLWEFSSVPRPGQIGHDTWEGDSWKGRLGANAWPFYFTVDEERDLLFLPLAAPVPWAYGGDRAGANLFGNSVVAVDVRTGEYVWHFQTIHHDLWDHDPPAPPVLFEIAGDDGEVPALAVTTKSGYLYILHRETGEPVYGVEEVAMPTSSVPGEETYPTQPIPIKPEAFGRVSYGPDDLVTAEDTTAEHAQACGELVESLGEIHNEGPFTPWVYRPSDGTSSRTTLLFPGLVGGHNWGGVAFDPATGYLLAFNQDLGTLGWVEEAAEDYPLPYALKTARPFFFGVQMEGQLWPCQKPPWGRLGAVDSTTGDIVWRQSVGLTTGLPAHKASTGRPGRAAAIVTAGGLIFIASTDDNRLRALDSVSGAELWVTELGGAGNANPITYRGGDGRQYVVITATEEVVAFRLP